MFIYMYSLVHKQYRICFWKSTFCMTHVIYVQRIFIENQGNNLPWKYNFKNIQRQLYLLLIELLNITL